MEEKSKFERVSENLYSRTRYKDPLEKKRTEIEPQEVPEVESGWQGPALDELLMRERKSGDVTPFIKKLFIFAALFFGAAVLVGGFIFFGGVNFVSSKNVDINIVGPTKVSAGDVAQLGVTISNKNNADLETTNFSVTFPAGTRDPKDTTKPLNYVRDSLGVIKAGDETVRNIEAVLIGSTGETKEIKFSVEYKVKGSNATFTKEKTYTIAIGDAPITLDVKSPSSVISGESFTTTVNVSLRSAEVLKNVMLRAEYPYGYSVQSSNPETIGESNVWALGDLGPGMEKKVEIRGQLVGENQDERTFRYYVGVADNESVSPNFKTVVVSTQETVAIERPSIGLSINFNGENVPTYVTAPGQNISTSISFQNNLPNRLLTPRVEVRLSGGALNKSSVQAQGGGTYDPNTGRLDWDILNTSGERELAPGERGVVQFNLASIAEALEQSGSKEIALQIFLTGTPAGENKPVTVSETRIIKVASQITLSARTTYSIGPFINTGPMPPKVGSETTYTATLSVANTQGVVNDAKITAKLPPGIKWLSSKSTQAEDVSYDEASRTVTWKLGAFSSGALTREVAFQVSLTPTLGQVGITPTLVNSIVFTATNSTTGRLITVINPALTTKMPSDPAFIQGDDIVVK